MTVRVRGGCNPRGVARGRAPLGRFRPSNCYRGPHSPPLGRSHTCASVGSSAPPDLPMVLDRRGRGRAPLGRLRPSNCYRGAHSPPLGRSHTCASVGSSAPHPAVHRPRHWHRDPGRYAARWRAPYLAPAAFWEGGSPQGGIPSPAGGPERPRTGLYGDPATRRAAGRVASGAGHDPQD